MFGFVLRVPVGGHPKVNYGCVQHWTCSVECYQQAMHACIDEYLMSKLRDDHAKVGV
jgi:hypothetical protein